MDKNMQALKGTHNYKTTLVSLCAPLLAVFWLISSGLQAHAQPDSTMKEIGAYAEKFAVSGVAAAGFAGHIGLSWSDMYIGQLIDVPPHWAIGLTAGVTSLAISSNISKLSQAVFGTELDESFSLHQLLLGYTIEGRIGGLKTLPFDIGFKWGWLPSLPLFANDISQEQTIYGLDFRYAVTRGWGKIPVIAVGFEIDQVNGGISHPSPSVSNFVDDTGATRYITPGDGAVTSLFYQAWVFCGKVGISKAFYNRGISVFGDLRIGASIGSGGYKITGDNIVVNSAGTSTALADLDDDDSAAFKGISSSLQAAQGGGSFLVAPDSLTSQYDASGLDINLCTGISFDFGSSAHLQLSVMFDFVHLEYGASLGFRFQQ